MNKKNFRLLLVVIILMTLITCQIIDGDENEIPQPQSQPSKVTDTDQSKEKTDSSNLSEQVADPRVDPIDLETETETGTITVAIDPIVDDTDSQQISVNDLSTATTVVDKADVVNEQEKNNVDVVVESSTPIVVAQHSIDDRGLNKKFCRDVSDTLTSLDFDDCMQQELQSSEYWTTDGNPLAYKVYPPLGGKASKAKILVIGGIHGDEYSAVSIVFKWMNILNVHHSGLFHWLFLPVANPDGLLKKPAQRQNGNGVDLNRNFPTSDWHELAMKYWEKKTYKNPRRYPGKSPSSEIETQWILDNIEKFNPDIVISVHAPFHLVDYDGPENPPQRIGNLYLSQLGVYPGSLGNYGGLDLKKPVVTIELPSAGVLPDEGEISRMWTDLVRWLINKSKN